MGIYQMDGINGINAAERLQILGSFQIIEKDLLGNVLSISDHTNLITNKFKAAVADSLTGDYDADKCTIGYIAVGTDDTAANATDTALGNQVGATRLTSPIQGTTTQRQTRRRQPSSLIPQNPTTMKPGKRSGFMRQMALTF